MGTGKGFVKKKGEELEPQTDFTTALRRQLGFGEDNDTNGKPTRYCTLRPEQSGPCLVAALHVPYCKYRLRSHGNICHAEHLQCLGKRRLESVRHAQSLPLPPSKLLLSS